MTFGMNEGLWGVWAAASSWVVCFLTLALAHDLRTRPAWCGTLPTYYLTYEYSSLIKFCFHALASSMMITARRGTHSCQVSDSDVGYEE